MMRARRLRNPDINKFSEQDLDGFRICHCSSGRIYLICLDPGTTSKPRKWLSSTNSSWEQAVRKHPNAKRFELHYLCALLCDINKTLLSTYRQQWKILCPTNWEDHALDHATSTAATAISERIGLIWFPIHVPRICRYVLPIAVSRPHSKQSCTSGTRCSNHSRLKLACELCFENPKRTAEVLMEPCTSTITQGAGCFDWNSCNIASTMASNRSCGILLKKPTKSSFWKKQWFLDGCFSKNFVDLPPHDGRSAAPKAKPQTVVRSCFNTKAAPVSSFARIVPRYATMVRPTRNVFLRFNNTYPYGSEAEVSSPHWYSLRTRLELPAALFVCETRSNLPVVQRYPARSKF